MKTPTRSRVVGIIGATALTFAALTAPVAAQAADTQICAPTKVPTAKTQPFYNLAQSKNPVWESIPAFDTYVANTTALAKTLSASSTPEQVDAALEANSLRSNGIYYSVYYSLLGVQASYYNFEAEIELADPTFDVYAYLNSLDSVLDTSFENTFETYLNDVYDAFDSGSYPITLPSSTATRASIVSFAKSVDSSYANALSKVVYQSGTKSTCVSVPTISLPAPTLSYGKGASFTVSATSSGLAAPGEFVVLLDGNRLSRTAQAAKATVTIPSATPAGVHSLTVAFQSSTGAPIATKTVKITVNKAKTTTKLKLAKKSIKKKKKSKVTVTVTVPGLSVKPTGTVIVKNGKKSVGSASLSSAKKGKVTVTIKAFPKKTKAKLTATFKGNANLAASTSSKVKLTVK